MSDNYRDLMSFVYPENADRARRRFLGGGLCRVVPYTVAHGETLWVLQVTPEPETDRARVATLCLPAPMASAVQHAVRTRLHAYCRDHGSEALSEAIEGPESYLRDLVLVNDALRAFAHGLDDPLLVPDELDEEGDSCIVTWRNLIQFYDMDIANRAEANYRGPGRVRVQRRDPGEYMLQVSSSKPEAKKDGDDHG